MFNVRNSFRCEVDVSRHKHGQCFLRFHFDHAMRAIVSRLDHLADQDQTGERFVFEQLINTAVKAARFQGGKRAPGVSFKTTMRVMKELRRLRVVSDRLQRTRNGRVCWGYIVTPHDALFQNDGKSCKHVGPRRGSGQWHRLLFRLEFGDKSKKHEVIFWAPDGWEDAL